MVYLAKEAASKADQKTKQNNNNIQSTGKTYLEPKGGEHFLT